MKTLALDRSLIEYVDCHSLQVVTDIWSDEGLVDESYNSTLVAGLNKTRPNPPIINTRRAPSILSISMSSGSPFDPRACFPPTLSLATVRNNRLFDLGVDRDSVHVFHHPLWHVRRTPLKLDIFRSKSSLGGVKAVVEGPGCQWDVFCWYKECVASSCGRSMHLGRRIWPSLEHLARLPC